MLYIKPGLKTSEFGKSTPKSRWHSYTGPIIAGISIYWLDESVCVV
jgi:hypothetical protein